MNLSLLTSHLKEYYDCHLAAFTASGVSLFSGLQDRLINIFWSIISGAAVWFTIAVLKKAFKNKL